MNEINSTHDIDTSTTSMTDADPHRGWLDERDAKLAYQRSPKGAALPDDEFNKISEEQCALEGRVINTPAFTPEGLAAQNQVLREYLEDGAMEPEVTVKLHEAILKSTAAVHGAASTATEADAAATADVIVNLFAERNRLCILYTEASDQDQPGEIVTEAHRKYSEIDGQIIDATAATPLGVAIKFWVACAYAEDCQIFDVRIDRCDVVIIDSMGESSTEMTPDATVQALETLTKLALCVVVIDFDHPLRAKLSQGRDAGDFIFVSTQPNPPDLDEHVSNNGAAIVFDGAANPPAFTLIDGDHPRKRIVCPELEKIENLEIHIRATAFAIASAFAIGISTDVDWQQAYDN